MDYTQTIGFTNELKCMLAFIQLGYECSIPFGNSAKYDFIADINGKLLKFQCKSSHYTNDHGKISKDSFTFSTSCTTTNTKTTKKHTYNSDQIDYFTTCFENKVYVIPVTECSTAKTLRFNPPNNGNLNYNKAEDYLITNFFKESLHYLQSKENYLNRLILKQDKEIPTCNICGKQVTKEGNLCEECSHLQSRKVERPSREELKILIRNTPFTIIGSNYGVSDNTIRKWCKNYKLPYKIGDIKNINDKDWEII